MKNNIEQDENKIFGAFPETINDWYLIS